MNRYIALFLLPLFITACDSKDSDPQPQPAPDFKNTIRLNDLEQGQVNHYLRYTANCSDPASSFTYTGDTLKVEIRSTTDGLVFYEEFTEGSTLSGGLEPSESRVISRDGYILIPERQFSQLFFFYGNDTIFLTKPEDLNLTQGNCFIEYENGEPFIGEEIGFLPDFQYQNIRHQNSRIVSCVPPIFLNLDAYLVYTKAELKMSQTIMDTGANLTIDGYTLLQ